ncbi:MAG: HTTM domain-containing protein [Paracoccaceae bacterium]
MGARQPWERFGARLGGLFSIDLRSLALFRVLLAIAILYSALILAPDLGAFFTDQGVLDRSAQRAAAPYGRISLLMLSGALWPAVLVWIGLVLAALALLFGWRARIAAFLAWVFYLSFAGRNGMIMQGGDSLIILLLFWAMFLPVSALFSVDAAIANEDHRAAPPYLSAATVGLLLQVVHVYVFGALLKTSPIWREDGAAVWLAIHLDSFATPLGFWLRHFILLTGFLTFFVLLLELLAPCLLFFPDARQRVRTVALAMLAAMHVGFRLFLDIGHFWLVSLASLAAFLPAPVWDRIAARYWRPEQRRIEIWYDRDCGFCLKTARLLREFFLPRAVPIRPAQDDPRIGALLERENSWVVVDGSGRERLRWDAVAFVMRQSPLLRPLGWLAGLYGAVGLGRPTYRLIGNSRGALGRLTGALFRPRAVIFRPGRAVSSLLALVIALCFGWNMREHFKDAAESGPYGVAVQRAAGAFGFTQRWSMFAPYPATADGYPLIAATMGGGSVLDLFRRPPAPPEAVAPTQVRDHFPSYRWRKYINNIAFLPEEERRERFRAYAAWACRRANTDVAAHARALRVSIDFIGARTIEGGRRAPIRWPIGAWDCPGPP